MLYVKEAAGVGPVDYLVEGVGLGGGGGRWVSVEGNVTGGEVVGVGGVVTASLVANVVVRVLGGGGGRRGGGGDAFDGGGEMGFGWRVAGSGVLGFEGERGRLEERGRCHC